MDILGVKKEALKQIEKKQQLNNRLQDKGYELLDKLKEGRQVYYIIEQTDTSKELLNNITTYVMNTKDDNKFSNYFMYRLINIEKPVTKELLSEYCEVNRNTITKWDKQMILNDILSKDGYFYIAVDYIDNESFYRITTQEEYKSYIKCSKFANKKKEIAQRYKTNDIDYETMQMLMDAVTVNAKTIESKFVYRVNKYQLMKNNQLYKDIYKLITNVYKEKQIENYYIDWLPSIK